MKAAGKSDWKRTKLAYKSEFARLISKSRASKRRVEPEDAPVFLYKEDGTWLDQ